MDAAPASVTAIGGGAVAALWFGSLNAMLVVLAIALILYGTTPLLAARAASWRS